MTSEALAGTKVLDLTRLAPGPYCSMLLADLGADVVVVGGGRSGLPIAELGRGKKFIQLDLKSKDGLAALHALARDFDVLIEGFRPGVMSRLGAGYEDLSAINPGLVYCSLTGYGQVGARSQTAGHDINYVALSGLLGTVGPTGAPPTVPLNLVADFAGGSLVAALGIVAALVERSRSGLGQHIDTSMVDGVMSMMAMHYSDWGNPVLPSRGTGMLSGGAPFYRCYECADGGFVAVGALEDAFFAALWTGLGLGAVPRHMDTTVWREIEERLTKTFLQRTRDEWAALFQDTDACVTPVLEPHEVFDEIHNASRHPNSSGVPVVPQMSRSRQSIHPTDLTDRTLEVLAEVGIDNDLAEVARGPLPDVKGLSWPPI